MLWIFRYAQNDKILVILGYFSFYHTDKPCHTELS